MKEVEVKQKNIQTFCNHEVYKLLLNQLGETEKSLNDSQKERVYQYAENIVKDFNDSIDSAVDLIPEDIFE